MAGAPDDNEAPSPRFWRKLERSLRRRLRGRPERVAGPEIVALQRQLDLLVEATARAEARRVAALPPGTPLAETEFRITSQFGEDGILQHLVAHVPFAERSFVEFGVEDFREANCRLLATLAPWRGLVLDGDPNLETVLRGDPLMFLRDLTPRSAFVTAENIDGLIAGAGFGGDLGVLSIDIDGNDYCVWEAIRSTRPRIVVVEYNSVFGPDAAVVVPYAPDFYRRTAHFSWLYAGASIAALALLGERKGYALIGSNSAGNNAFFVRKDVLGVLRPVTASEAWVESTFRESRDEAGRMTFLSGRQRLELIADMPLIDVRTGATVSGRTIM
jgi:hypothetical protein